MTMAWSQCKMIASIFAEVWCKTNLLLLPPLLAALDTEPSSASPMLQVAAVVKAAAAVWQC
jgi:hypothetical protein